ncbi:MAG: endonuclease III, partial [Deltaproteobacteria bacterium]|nr:endonuclease III [Deltaproteobacteria bacterium]
MPPGKRPGPVPFILEFLACAYSSARVVLRYRTPFELLVATVLAAQCTDDRVNQVTPTLFVRYPGPEAFAAASLPEIEKAVRPTGFYRNKAKALKGIASALVARHGGNVPKSMEELTALPGVGRKTASVILGACFGVDALPVDTHVGRVSSRLGLTRSKDPARIEEDLVEAVPNGRWDFATQLGWHGRQVCVARQPR